MGLIQSLPHLGTLRTGQTGPDIARTGWYRGWPGVARYGGPFSIGAHLGAFGLGSTTIGADGIAELDNTKSKEKGRKVI